MATGDRGSRLVGNTEFYGGLSTDDKIGIENSYADAECLDVRKSPSQISILPKPKNATNASVITGLITAMTQTKDGTIWALDENDCLYSIDNNNSVTKVFNSGLGPSGHGMVYSRSIDALVFTNGASIVTYGQIINPRNAARTTNQFAELDDYSEYIVNSITKNYHGDYISNADVPRNDPGEYGNGTENQPTYYDYTCLDTISENEDDKALFLPAITPVKRIGVYIKTLGSGTIKVVVHDIHNRVVAESSEIAASNLTANAYNYFDVRPNPSTSASAGNQFELTPWSGATEEAGDELHIHIVCSTADYVIQSVTENNGNASLYYGMRFVVKGAALAMTYNGRHPIAIFDKIYIGNGRYLAELGSTPLDYIDDTTYIANRLRLDDGYEICSIATTDEYIVIGAEKRSTTSGRSFQSGIIYFWDGQSDNPNFYIECPMGSPSCLYNFNNILYVLMNGALYAYTGGKELIKVRTMRGTDTEFSGANTTLDILPNMITTRREIMMLGFPSTTTAKSIKFGIYGWGTIDKNFPNSFTYNYNIPGAPAYDNGGNYNSNTTDIKLGCVYNFGDSLFFGYAIKTGSDLAHTYSLAVVDNTCGAASKFYWESLIYDAGSPILEKSALRIGIYFDALPINCTITPIYRIDEMSENIPDIETITINGKVWYKGAKTATAGDRKVTCEVGGVGSKRIHEFQYGFIGVTPNGNKTPVIKQVVAEIRINNEEVKI